MRHWPAIPVLAALCLDAQTGPVAVLLEKSGSWKLDGAPVAVGVTLRAGQRLELEQGEIGAIRVVYFSGERGKCISDEEPPCSRFEVRNAAAPVSSAGQRLFNLLSGLTTSYLRVGSALSRSSNLPDQLAEAEGPALRIPAPLAAAKLSFRRLDAQGIPAASGQPVSHPGGTVIPVRLSPGLYRVDVLNTAGRPSGDYFWLFAPAPGALREARAGFGLLRDLAADWPVEDSAARDRLLRAYLLEQANKP